MMVIIKYRFIYNQKFRTRSRGRLKSREGSRESALGRLARRTRGSIPAAGCDRACNAARRPKALSPVGLPRFWRWPALLAWPRSLRISALRSRLAQRQNRRNATPSYFLDILLGTQRANLRLPMAPLGTLQNVTSK